MGLFQSLNVGVSGLKSQANKLGVVSDNISNVNTIGYKGGIANFSSMVYGFSAGSYQAGGVRGGHQQTNQQNGLVTATTSRTDLAISGRGFFPVSRESTLGSDISYTRAGSFNTNENGDYLNSNGYFLKGWRLDANGDLPTSLSGASITQATAEAALQTINVADLTIEAIPTTGIAIRANLKSNQLSLPSSSVSVVGSMIHSQTALPTTTANVVTNLKSSQTAVSGSAGYDPLDNTKNMATGSSLKHYTVPLSIYDSTGAERSANISYIKTAANSWAVEIYSQVPADITPIVGYPAGLIAYGDVTFNGDGTLATISSTLTDPATITWTSPSATSTISFNFGTVDDSDGLKQSTSSFAGFATLRPDYDPTVTAQSMASGAITPHYSTTMTVTDNTGVTHDISANFIKTAAHTWEIELVSVPDTDLATSNGSVAGQIAYGTATFNADGTLKSISSSLTNPIAIDWAGTIDINTVQFNWGEVNNTTGLQELSAVGSVFAGSATVTQNYAAADATKNMTSGTVIPHFSRDLDVVDFAGNLKTLKLYFLKIGVNQWAMEVAANDAADVTSPTAQIAYGVVNFNGDGTLNSVSDALSDAIDVPWSSGGDTSITFSLGTAGPIYGTVGATVVGLSDGLTQFEDSYFVRSLTQNGSVAGENATVSIDENGYVIGEYTNGSVRRLYKIPLASFVSPDKLNALSGNVFLQSNNSGDAVYFGADVQQQSIIQSSALESSNVELSNELSNMIIAQRAYQSNAKLITTSDNMLETLTQL